MTVQTMNVKNSEAMRCNASKKPIHNRGDQSISQMTLHQIYRGQVGPTFSTWKQTTQKKATTAQTQMTKSTASDPIVNGYVCVCVLDLHMKRNCQVKICTITSKAFFHVFLNSDENNSNLKSIYADNYYSNFHTIRIWCHVQLLFFLVWDDLLSLSLSRSTIFFLSF